METVCTHKENILLYIATCTWMLAATEKSSLKDQLCMCWALTIIGLLCLSWLATGLLSLIVTYTNHLQNLHKLQPLKYQLFPNPFAPQSMQSCLPINKPKYLLVALWSTLLQIHQPTYQSKGLFHIKTSLQFGNESIQFFCKFRLWDLYVHVRGWNWHDCDLHSKMDCFSRSSGKSGRFFKRVVSQFSHIRTQW